MKLFLMFTVALMLFPTCATTSTMTQEAGQRVDTQHVLGIVDSRHLILTKDTAFEIKELENPKIFLINNIPVQFNTKYAKIFQNDKNNSEYDIIQQYIAAEAVYFKEVFNHEIAVTKKGLLIKGLPSVKWEFEMPRMHKDTVHKQVFCSVLIDDLIVNMGTGITPEMDQERVEKLHKSLVGSLALVKGDSGISTAEMIRKTKNPEAMKYYNQGVEAFAKKDYEAAVTAYKKSLEIDPEFVDALDNLGLSYRRMGQLEKAKKSYMQALEIIPENHIAHQNIAMVYLEENNKKKALEHYNKVVEYKQESAEGFYGRGLVQLKMKKLKEALYDFKKAEIIYELENSHYISDAQFYIAAIYYTFKDYEKAIQYYEKIYDAFNRHPKVNLHLGFSYYLSENSDIFKTVHYLSIAKELGEKEAGKLIDSIMEDLTEKRSELLEACENNDAAACFYEAYRLMHVDKNKTDEIGTLLFKSAKSGYPYAVNIFVNLFGDECMQGQEELCLLSFDVLHAGKQYDKAMVMIEKAITLNPENGAHYYNKACILSLMGKKKAAIKFLDKALRKKPELKEHASKDEDFNNIREMEAFKQLIQ